ncbi:MAG: GNAT family N-acetyltransferase, partial [Chloroflexi bacterium]|nr:GNAT family N-acetyltransferase [Chloroflexota bacterium]
QTSRVMGRVDDTPVWSVVCFFVEKRHRKQGVTEFLVRAAIDYARAQGASVLEAYPYDPKADRASAMSAFMGLASTFRRLGFVEVARRSESRPIMRYTL